MFRSTVRAHGSALQLACDAASIDRSSLTDAALLYFPSRAVLPVSTRAATILNSRAHHVMP